MVEKWSRIMVAAVAVVSLWLPSVAFAGADDLAKQADKIVRTAERAMHNGKNEEASTILQEAAALLARGKAEEPANAKIAQTEKKLDRLRQTIDKKLGKSAAGSASSGRPLPDTPQPKAMSARSATTATSATETAAGKLPAGVKKRLADIDKALDRADEYADSDAKKATRWLKEAEETLATIDRMYADQFDAAHPDYVAGQERYQTLARKVAEQGEAEAKAAANAAAAEDAREEQSASWVARFQEYLSYPGNEGHNPDKLVFVPGTSEPEKFADAKKRYEAFKAFYAEYQTTDFPAGRTFALEDIADNQAPQRMKDFEEGFASRLGSAAEGIDNEMSEAMAYLEKDNGWKSDNAIRPNLLDRQRMATIREAMEKALTALGPETPQAREIKAKFAALVAKDKENRQIRMERTYMIADRYTGDDLEALKKKAAALVANDHKEGGTPLRTTIIAENWREETVQEWTDTSKSAMRWRTTRHETAQVAAKAADGVRLITVALAQDKQSDGNWGPLYGNLHQGFDPMVETNVEKNAP